MIELAQQRLRAFERHAVIQRRSGVEQDQRRAVDTDARDMPRIADRRRIRRQHGEAGDAEHDADAVDDARSDLFARAVAGIVRFGGEAFGHAALSAAAPDLMSQRSMRLPYSIKTAEPTGNIVGEARHFADAISALLRVGSDAGAARWWCAISQMTPITTISGSAGAASRCRARARCRRRRASAARDDREQQAAEQAEQQSDHARTRSKTPARRRRSRAAPAAARTPPDDQQQRIATVEYGKETEGHCDTSVLYARHRALGASAAYQCGRSRSGATTTAATALRAARISARARRYRRKLCALHRGAGHGLTTTC